MQSLRKWVTSRKRRSYGELRKSKNFTRSGSFRVLEENREEIKLLNAFRINLKKERSKRRIFDDSDETKEETNLESHNSNESLK